MRSKYNPHKSCGCRMCRYGRGTKSGQYTLRQAEKTERQLTKVKLKKDPYNYEPVLVATDYTD